MVNPLLLIKNQLTHSIMSLALQTIFTNKNPSSLYISLCRTHLLKTSNFPFSALNSKTYFPDYRLFTSNNYSLPVTKIQASFEEPYGTGRNRVNGNRATSDDLNFDAFLSILEFLSLASSAAISIYVAMSSGIQKGEVLKWVGGRVLVWQSVALLSSVVVGAVIRRRQWRRISGVGFSRGPASPGANLLERVEKVEEDLRSSATIIRVMSRQLEKLGIRFRVTRKALKEPIAETAALVQKNSEATRALAAQEEILERELGEIQKVLLAMQEQQQKQLQLILAIGKAGKLWETKHGQSQDQKAPEASKSSVPEASKSSVHGVSNLEINQIEALGLQKEANSDRL